MKVVACCHDAGGAEMVSAWLRREANVDFTAMLDGPAEAIFERKFGEGLKRTVFGFSGADLVLCGSSVENALEILSWRCARVDGVRTATFLDHWKNYGPRFRTDEGLLALPDQIWVTDRFAADLARREVPGARVAIKGNPYLEETVAAVRQIEWRTVARGIPPEREMHVLFVHEPGREKEYHRWMRRGFRKGQLLRERPHPSVETPEQTLAEDLAWADVVVGCDSMALAVALRAKRRVISILPKGEELTIPFPGIERW